MPRLRTVLHRFLALFLAALLLAGCAGLRRSSETRGLTRIVETGVIRVGTSGEQPPLTMTGANGELFGLDVALANVLARSMGVRAEFVRLPFRELLDELEKGRVDLVMSGLTITPERARRVAFVGPYFTSGKSVLTRSEELAAVAAPDPLDSPALRIAALRGSTSEQFVRTALPRAELRASDGLDDAVERVIRGEVDALVADRETCAFAVLRHPEAGLLVSATSFTVEPMGIAIPLDQPQLANLVQTYLNALAESGALEKARQFWFQDDAWVGNLR